MKDYIEFWEFIQPSLGSDFYRYTFVNKSKIESIIIRWDTQEVSAGSFAQ